MTTESKTVLERIWQNLLDGTLTPEQARAILPKVYDASGQGMTADSIESFLARAAEVRQEGIASGAAWAQPKPVQGPINVGANRTAQGNLRPNQGPLPELINPFGAYQRGLASAGLNAGIGGGEFGRYLQNQRFAPTNAVFLGQKTLGNLPGENLEQFAGRTRGGDLGAEAQNTFQGLLNQLRGGNTQPESPIMQFLEDYGPGADLAREAAGKRLGNYAASRLLPSSDELIRQFRAGPTGAQNTDFLAYLQRALGL